MGSVSSWNPARQDPEILTGSGLALKALSESCAVKMMYLDHCMNTSVSLTPFVDTPEQKEGCRHDTKALCCEVALPVLLCSLFSHSFDQNQGQSWQLRKLLLIQCQDKKTSSIISDSLLFFIDIYSVVGFTCACEYLAVLR